LNGADEGDARTGQDIGQSVGQDVGQNVSQHDGQNVSQHDGQSEGHCPRFGGLWQGQTFRKKMDGENTEAGSARSRPCIKRIAGA
jgi:hypothetical protein